MGIDVASATLDTNIQGLEFAPQAMGEVRELRRIGKCPAKTELSFENAFRSGEAAAGEQCRRDASLGRFTQM